MKKFLLSVVATLTMTATAFAQMEVGNQYTRVESTEDLTVGDHYILCYETNVMGALSGKYHSRLAGGVTLSADSKTATLTNDGLGALDIVLVNGTAANTYAFQYGSDANVAYLTCTSITNNNLGSSSSLTDKANLSITISNGVATIIPTANSNSNKCKIQYNSNSGLERFSNYKTGTQKNCSLYKKISAPAEETKVATPTFNPESGEVAKGTVVTISCATEGATIEYVLNGGSDYIEYKGEEIVINEATTIEAYATKDGLDMSEIAEAAYTIALEQVAAPTFDPASGSVERGSEVTIACATEGATIYYQANNGEMLEYTGEPIVINEATKIEAWAEKDGMKDSEIVSASYTIVGEESHAPEAMFNFTEPASLGVTNPGSVLNHPFTVNGVTVEFTKAATGNEPTFYATGGYHVRVYKNATIVVSAEEGKSIESITFTGATLYRIQHDGKAIAETGQTTVNWWSPSLDARAAAPNTVTFTIDNTGRADIKTMKVNDPVVTGVEDVVVDENAPVEFYNLQGVRVANPENGIFIRRQGKTVTKVLVK